MTDEESDKLMEEMVADAAVKPAEEEPTPETEAVTKKEKAKAKKTKK